MKRVEIRKSDWAYEVAEITWNCTDEENRINLLRSKSVQNSRVNIAVQYQFSELSEPERLIVINNFLVKISH